MRRSALVALLAFVAAVAVRRFAYRKENFLIRVARCAGCATVNECTGVTRCRIN